MKKVFKYTLIVLLIVALVVAGLIASFIYKQKQQQPQMFAEPVFETERPELAGDFNRPSILVFSKTNGFRHFEAIDAANTWFKRLEDSRGWTVYVTESSAVFNDEQLALFDVVVWNSATGPVLLSAQQAAFERYLEGGGAYLGIHAAGDGSHADWDWYVSKVIRANFTMHSMWPQFQTATVHTEGADHPAMRHLPEYWELEEEWYSFEHSPRLQGATVLATVDEKTYDPNWWPMGEDHPVIWSHTVGDGRVFYLALGHQPQAFEDQRIQLILEQAIIWAGRLENE